MPVQPGSKLFIWCLLGIVLGCGPLSLTCCMLCRIVVVGSQVYVSILLQSCISDGEICIGIVVLAFLELAF